MAVKKIMVFMGGSSSEREISLRSGRAVLQALLDLGYEAAAFDLMHEPISKFLDFSPELVFVALHGKNGEDGTIQGMLEILGVPYTGSGVAASAICMDKALTKRILDHAGLPTPAYKIYQQRDFTSLAAMAQDAEQALGMPLVVKAVSQGSSIGVYIVKKAADIEAALEQAFALDQTILVEKFIAGREITASVVGNEDPVVFPLIEITSQNAFYDYEAKYTPGRCEHIIPARIPQAAAEQIATWSKKAYTVLNCKGFARVDFMLTEKGEPLILELNTVPGFTEMSLVPDAARAAGVKFTDLVERIVQLAQENYNGR